ncbi:hypothetical protein ACFVH6_17110 [Spirillospora sp. NPDC127200]
MGTFLVRVWEGSGGPRLDWRDPGAERVLIAWHGAPRALLQMRRSPGGAGAERPYDDLLVADADERSATWLACADVIVRRAAGRVAVARAFTTVRTSFPGCLVTAVFGGGEGRLLETATGWCARLLPARPGDFTAADVVSCAITLHAWVVSGRPPGDLDTASFSIMRGRASVRPSITVRAAAPWRFRERGDGVRRAGP